MHAKFSPLDNLLSEATYTQMRDAADKIIASCEAEQLEEAKRKNFIDSFAMRRRRE